MIPRRTTIAFNIHDTPIPQGSKRNYGKGRVVENNHERQQPWREAVKTKALNTMLELNGGEVKLPMFARDEPVGIEIIFTFARPRSHYRTGRFADAIKISAPSEHAGSPDLDKLVRGVFDALTAAGVWWDDRQVARLIARKEYTNPRMQTPGATIRITGANP